MVYTKEAETADAYIEKTTYELSRKKYRVRVATSDYAEQMIILGHGALRLSATTFHAEVEQAADRSTLCSSGRTTASAAPARWRRPWSGPGKRADSSPRRRNRPVINWVFLEYTSLPAPFPGGPGRADAFFGDFPGRQTGCRPVK